MYISAVVLTVLWLSVISVAHTASVPVPSEESSAGYSFKLIAKIYDDCSGKDSVATCLKGKAIRFFDRAITSDQIPLTDNVVLVKDESSRSDYARALTDGELDQVMATSSEETRENALNKLLFDRIARLFTSHTMKLSLPQVTSEDIARSVEQGRGKMKKMMSMMMMAGSMKMMMLVPIAIGALFLLAGKALIISKIALVLALIITLKKLLSGKQGGHEMHGWSSGGGGHGGGGGGGWDKRSLANNDLAHDLAYNSYARK